MRKGHQVYQARGRRTRLYSWLATITIIAVVRTYLAVAVITIVIIIIIIIPPILLLKRPHINMRSDMAVGGGPVLAQPIHLHPQHLEVTIPAAHGGLAAPAGPAFLAIPFITMLTSAPPYPIPIMLNPWAYYHGGGGGGSGSRVVFLEADLALGQLMALGYLELVSQGGHEAIILLDELSQGRYQRVMLQVGQEPQQLLAIGSFPLGTISGDFAGGELGGFGMITAYGKVSGHDVVLMM